MRSIKGIIAIMLVSGAAFSGLAWADRYGHGGGHVGIGVVIGPSWGWPYYPPSYYYPNYYAPYPPTVVIQSPPIYVEKDTAASSPAQLAENFWYFCSSPQGYYPYIKECPAGWQKVIPHPPQ